MSTMIGTLTINAAFLQDIKQDSRHVHDLLTSLRSLISHRASLHSHRRRFVDLLEALCDQLAMHFTLEEAFGYFEDAVDAAPRLAERAEELQREHVALFDTIRDIGDDATDAERDGRWLAALPDIIRRFRQFDHALQQHESVENALIMEALCDDIGSID